jgi:hypothetical protein
MKKVGVTRESECYKLKMTISEASINSDTHRLQYINVDR